MRGCGVYVCALLATLCCHGIYKYIYMKAYNKAEADIS